MKRWFIYYCPTNNTIQLYGARNSEVYVVPYAGYRKNGDYHFYTRKFFYIGEL